MELIQQLRNPKPKTVKGPDGSDIMTYTPPTALELRAASEIEKLIMVNQGLVRSLQTQEKFQ